MTQYTLVEGKRYHCGQMARMLRRDHTSALAAVGLSVHRELRSAFEISTFSRAWLIDGKLAALGGVIGASLASSGFVWLAMTDTVRGHTLAAVREAKKQISALMLTKASLKSKLIPGDDAARKFALFLGFRPSGDDQIEYRTEWPETGAPFVVFSLPRSRSRWLASFLSNGAECSHDLPVTVGSVDELCEAVSRGGSVETGLVSAWRLLRQRFPEVRFAVVQRPIAEVKASAARFGWVFPDGYLEAQDRGLQEISEQPGTLALNHLDLGTEDGCRSIYEYCTGQLFDPAQWRRMDAQNIQIDMDGRLALLGQNADRMGRLFEEINAAVTIQEEPFDTFYRDGQELFDEHRAEAGSFDGLDWDPDIEKARAMESAGRILVLTARKAGKIVGYLLYLLDTSFESKTVLLAYQNVFFVRKKHRGTLGARLYDIALEKLRDRGVKAEVLRSGVRARGPKLRALFERKGAVLMGSLYYLWLEN